MTDSSNYPAFGKIPRLNRPVLWTEKIDGTNGLVSIVEYPYGALADVKLEPGMIRVTGMDTDDGGFPVVEFTVRAGSRNRWLTPSSDNYGFSKWVQENSTALVKLLGEGNHYGEWWGQGIQRKYDMDHKEFSLFNAVRWEHLNEDDAAVSINLNSVPLLCQTTGFDPTLALKMLEQWGSFAAPGWQKPEGVVGFHDQSRTSFKVLIENDHKPKGESNG